MMQMKLASTHQDEANCGLSDVSSNASELTETTSYAKHLIRL